MTPADKKHRSKRRRAALRHAFMTQAPIRLTGGRLARVRPGKMFCVNSRTITFPELDDELCGLKITHLSDPHVGELITPAHLPHIVQAANELGGDLIAVTGDFIDFDNRYLPAVIDAMKQLTAPLGVYFVLGNHDYLDDAVEVKRAFRKAGLNLLLNDVVRLKRHEKSIAIGGIDWAEQPEAIEQTVTRTAKRMTDCDLCVLLAHHPHAFDAACRCNIDLTLSGHTHGGQLLLSSNFGKKGTLGLANLGFRYTRGLYQRGQSALFVSSGVGSWFPLRIRCPAEITLLDLQSAY